MTSSYIYEYVQNKLVYYLITASNNYALLQMFLFLYHQQPKPKKHFFNKTILSKVGRFS